jgi:hypothetical protein
MKDDNRSEQQQSEPAAGEPYEPPRVEDIDTEHGPATVAAGVPPNSSTQ